MPGVIAVAVDGSDPSFAALDWAQQAADRHAVALLAVIITPPALERSRNSIRTVDRHQYGTTDAITVIRGGIDRVTHGAPVPIEVHEGNPVEVLLAISERVDLLVIGGHAQGGWRDSLTGSVADQLAVRTRVPLCIVRDRSERRHGLVLVGHETSGSGAAVGYAATQAERLGASLHVLSTWQYPRDTRVTAIDPAVLLEEGAKAAVAGVVADVQRSHPTVTVTTAVRFGQLAAELADLSPSADLVVIGAPGRGGLANLVVGSVAVAVVHRVATPVIVVPD